MNEWGRGRFAEEESMSNLLPCMEDRGTGRRWFSDKGRIVDIGFVPVVCYSNVKSGPFSVSQVTTIGSRDLQLNICTGIVAYYTSYNRSLTGSGVGRPQIMRRAAELITDWNRLIADPLHVSHYKTLFQGDDGWGDWKWICGWFLYEAVPGNNLELVDSLVSTWFWSCYSAS